MTEIFNSGGPFVSGTRETVRAHLGLAGWELLKRAMATMSPNTVLYHALLNGLDHGEDREARSRRCVRAAWSFEPRPPGMLFDPLQGSLYDAAQARHARGSTWNIRVMILAGWGVDQMNKWVEHGQIAGQVVQGSA